jgi:hypothetical protein
MGLPFEVLIKHAVAHAKKLELGSFETERYKTRSASKGEVLWFAGIIAYCDLIIYF